MKPALAIAALLCLALWAGGGCGGEWFGVGGYQRVSVACAGQGGGCLYCLETTMSDLERIVAERIAADAQAQMGHADPAMTRHYSHPTDAGQKSAAERIGRLLAEG